MMHRLHGAAIAMGRRGCGAFVGIARLDSRRTFSATGRHSALENAGDNLIHRSAVVDLTRLRPTSGSAQAALRSLSSAPSPSPPPPPTTDPTQAGDGGNKGIFGKIWDRYSFQGQQKRIILGERLFRSAQYRANDPRWYQEGRIPYEFRPRHALLTMHVWFLHKRLLADRVDSHLALLVQEELFDILWNDTRARIRAEGVNELTVNKHLKEVQELTFLHCCHYDHAYQEFANDDFSRLEEIVGIIWTYVLNKDEEAYPDLIQRLAAYVEYQYINLLEGVPDSHFWEGRIPWGDIPEFDTMKDNNGKVLGKMGEVPGLDILPKHWLKTLTDAGDKYYWNTETNVTSWKKPS
ncbi:hypothetical protein ACHAWF_014736 [Thalassiosira exigua]